MLCTLIMVIYCLFIQLQCTKVKSLSEGRPSRPVRILALRSNDRGEPNVRRTRVRGVAALSGRLKYLVHANVGFRDVEGFYFSPLRYDFLSRSSNFSIAYRSIVRGINL